MNRNYAKSDYAKPDGDGNVGEYAPLNNLVVGTRLLLNPRPQDYVAAGYYPFSREDPPAAPEGKVAVAGPWRVRDGAWRREWAFEDAPAPAYRTFSKYRLVSALMAGGVWERVKAWIEATPGAYDLYQAAEDVYEGDPLFRQGLAAVQESLGWTDAQVESVLAASVMEDA